MTALSEAAQTETLPNIKTRILRCIPAPPHQNSGEMDSLPNMIEILRCLVGFKEFFFFTDD